VAWRLGSNKCRFAVDVIGKLQANLAMIVIKKFSNVKLSVP
jgi:hypothetical protein